MLFAFSAGRKRKLIMAFLAFGTTDVLNGNAVHFAALKVLMEFLVNAVEFVTIPG